MKKKVLLKKISAIVLALAMVVTGISLPAPSGQDVAQAAGLTDYQSMSWTDLLNSEENLTWVFTGDSITHVADFTSGLNGYPEYIDQLLLETGRTDDTVINSAWGGVTLKNIYNDTENFITKYNPDILCIKIGMNDRIKTDYGTDFADKVEIFEEMYRVVLDRALEAGEANGKVPKIVLISPTPRSNTDTLANKDQFDEDTCWPFALVAEKLAKEYDVDYIDFMTAFAEEGKILGDEYMYTFFTDDSDGATHPNQAAQYFMFETVAKHMQMWDENSPICQLEYGDLNDRAMYADITGKVSGVARIGSQYYNSLAEAFAAAKTDGSTTTIVMTADTTVSSVIQVKNGAKIILTDDGTARKISRASSATGFVFQLMDGSQVTMQGSSNSDDNVTLTIDGAGVTATAALVCVGATVNSARDAATFTMNRGVALQNNTSSYVGGVRVQSTFIMNGGYIRNNTNTNDNAGGVVIRNNGQMQMNGGTISGNKLTAGGKCGAGIEISGSVAAPAFIMTGGTITGNTATNNGGGIRAQSAAKITGGVIKDNTASTAGTSGVRVSNANLTLGGTAQIDEIWLATDKTIVLDSALTAASEGSMLVTLQSAQNDGFALVTGTGISSSYDKFDLKSTTQTIGSDGKLATKQGGGSTTGVAKIGGTTYASLAEAFAAVPTNGTQTTIVMTGDAEVDSRISLASGKNVVLTDDGTARTISRASSFNGDNSSLFLINDGAKLTLRGTSNSDSNITLVIDGQKVQCAKNRIIDVGSETGSSTAELVMNAGVALQNNYSTYCGGVLVYAKFTMNGGIIQNNTAGTDNGGGVLIRNNGTMTMNGGTIRGNSAKNGAGIDVNGNVTSEYSLVMNGGSITGNEATATGGGIRLQGKPAKFLGGTVKDNTSGTAGAEGVYTAATVSNIVMGGDVEIDKIYLDKAGAYIQLESAVTKTHGLKLGSYANGTTVLKGEGVTESIAKFTLAEDGYGINSKGQITEVLSGEGLVVSAAVTKILTKNYVWAIAGGAQMSSVETINGHRNMGRIIENTVRYSTAQSGLYRSIRMVQASAPGYDVDYLLQNYEELIGQFNPQVLMLMPEISEVYEDGYTHSQTKVEAYKEKVVSLLNQEGIMVKILITPIPAEDDTINGYLDDYVNALREIATESPTLPFIDLNSYVAGNMANDSTARNWFGTDMNIQPVAAIEFAKYILEQLEGMGVSWVSYYNLDENTYRESTDDRVFDTSYRTDNIPATVTKDGMSVTVDVSAIKSVYSGVKNLRFAWLPFAGCGNYNKNIKTIDSSNITTSGNKYTFVVPAGESAIGIYGEVNGKTYRFEDIQVTVSADETDFDAAVATIGTVNAQDGVLIEMLEASAESLGVTSNTLTAARSSYNALVAPKGIYLDSLEVVGAPAIPFNKSTSDYSVELYQYQRTIQILATAHKDLTVKVDGKEVTSGVVSQDIEVALDATKTVKVEVTDGDTTATYNVKVTRPAYPDIIVTEVISNGHNYSYTANGATHTGEYDMIEIYNASGKTLNLKDYSIGYKKDFVQTGAKSKTDYPYYFSGNAQAFTGCMLYSGVNQITKYATTMNKTEPASINFPADSTMVIWVKYIPTSDTAYVGDSETFDSLLTGLSSHGNQLVTEIDGVSTDVLPKTSQFVMAEVPLGTTAGRQSTAATTTPDSCPSTFYLDGVLDLQTAITNGNAFNRSWLFVLDAGAERDSHGMITEAGNDIHTAANYVRPDAQDNGTSTIFQFNVDRGMSEIPNSDNYKMSDTKELFYSHEQSYSTYNTLGSLEYFQKPLDLDDETAPTVTNNTTHNTTNNTLNFNLSFADNTDVRYMEINYRTADSTEWQTVRKDFVLESCVKNSGKAVDTKTASYQVSLEVGAVSTDDNLYYGYIVDGNGNKTKFSDETCKVETEKVNDISQYRGTTYTAPTKTGYVFGGWYTSETCETPIATNVTTGSAYAKWVPEHVLETKAQVSANLLNADTTDDATAAIRFVTTVDSLGYKEMGFDIAIPALNYTAEKKSHIVYSTLYAVGATEGKKLSYDPQQFCIASEYFKTWAFTDIPSSAFDTEIKVTPFWITLDGTRVTGLQTTKTVNGVKTGIEE